MCSYAGSRKLSVCAFVESLALRLEKTAGTKETDYMYVYKCVIFFTLGRRAFLPSNCLSEFPSVLHGVTIR